MPDGTHSMSTVGARDYFTFAQLERSAVAEPKGHVELHVGPDVFESTTSRLKDEGGELQPVLMLLTSSMCFTAMQCLVRYVTSFFHIPVMYTTFYCGVVKIISSVLLLLFFGHPLDVSDTSLVDVILITIRGVFGAVAIITNYAALRCLPVGVTTCLSSMTPAVTSLLGWLFLKEKTTPISYAMLAVITLGSVLVGVSEPFPLSNAAFSNHLQGVCYSFLTALSTGIVYVIMRHLGSRGHVLWIEFAVSVCCMLTPVLFYCVQNDVAATLTFFTYHTMRLSGTQHFALARIGLLNVAFSVLLNYGSRLVRAGKSAILMMVNIPLSFLFAFLLLGEFPTSPLEIFGCFLIVMCTYITAIQRNS